MTFRQTGFPISRHRCSSDAMRIAIISDIHGNSVALEFVLGDLSTEQIDCVVCLGDTASDGPQPREVISQLRRLDCSVIMGNMDAWALNPHPLGGKSKNAQLGNEIRLWGVSQLSPEDLNFLRAFEATVKMPLDSSTDLLCYHGSPQSFEDVIASTTPDVDLERMLSGCHAAVLAGGHTHTQMLRRFGDTIIINPGSVGAPPMLGGCNPGLAWAEYGIVCWSDGSLGIEFRRVPVDVNLLIQAASDGGMPHADWWVQSRYGPNVALSSHTVR